MLLGMKEGELAGLGEAMRTCLALVDEWGGLVFELPGDFRLELGDFPGAIDASVEDFRDVRAEDEGGDLNLAGGALLGEEEGLRKRAGTFLFLFPRSKSDNTGCSLLWSELDSLVVPIASTSLPCKLVTCLLRVSTFELA